MFSKAIVARILKLGCRAVVCSAFAIAVPGQADPICRLVDSSNAPIKPTQAKVARVIDAPFAETPVSIQAIGQSAALIIYQSSIYRTLDGGRTWKKLGYSNESGYRINIVRFRDVSFGVVVAVAETDDLRRQRFKVLSTSDGGDSWKTIQRRSSANLSDVLIRTRSIELLVNSYPPMWEQEIVSSDDDGRTWRVERLKLGEFLGPQGDTFRPPLARMIESESSGFLLFSRFGQIFKRAANGVDFAELRNPCEIAPITSSGIGPKDRLWMSSGSDGLEGPRAEIVRQTDAGIWERIRLPLALGNALVSGAGTIIVGGRLLDSGRGAGIIVSVDDGRSWSLAFHDKALERISVMALMPDGTVWASGDNGQIVILEMD